MAAEPRIVMLEEFSEQKAGLRHDRLACAMQHALP